MYPDFAEQARADGLPELAKIFEMVANIEKNHERTFMEEYVKAYADAPRFPFRGSGCGKTRRRRVGGPGTGKKPLVLSKLRHIAACSVVTWRISVWMSARYAKPLVHLKKLDKYIRMGSPVLLICWSGSVGRAADS